MRRAVFDMDGTIALVDQRRYLTEVHWPSFERSCVTDLPNKPVIAVLHALYLRDWRVEVWSARSEKVRGYTEDWLDEHVDLAACAAVRMRPEHDQRDDAVLKEEWLLAATARGERPDLVFDDRQKVVDMWRRNGVPCFQVAPGDF